MNNTSIATEVQVPSVNFGQVKSNGIEDTIYVQNTEGTIP